MRPVIVSQWRDPALPGLFDASRWGFAEFADEHHDNYERTQDRHGKGEYECPYRFPEVKSLRKRPNDSAGDSRQIDQDERNFQRSKFKHFESSTPSCSERTVCRCAAQGRRRSRNGIPDRHTEDLFVGVRVEGS